MALNLIGLKNNLFSHSKNTGEGYYDKKNPDQDIANEEVEYSICLSDFQPKFSLSGDFERNNTAIYNREAADSILFFGFIHLPNGVKIKTCNILAEESTQSWGLQKSKFDGSAASTIATANLNTEATGIDEIIDNNTYQYAVYVTLLKDKELWGGKITYEKNFT